MNKNDKKEEFFFEKPLFVYMLISIFALMRLYVLNDTALSLDEINWYYIPKNKELFDFLLPNSGTRFHLFFYYLFMKLWINIVPDSVFFLRLPSWFFSLVSLLVIWKLSEKWIDRKFSVAVLIFFGLSSLHFFYSSNLGPWSFLIAAIFLTPILVYRFLDEPNYKNAILLISLQLVCLCTSVIYVPVFLSFLIFVFLDFRNKNHRFKNWIIVSGLLLGFFLIFGFSIVLNRDIDLIRGIFKWVPEISWHRIEMVAHNSFGSEYLSYIFVLFFLVRVFLFKKIRIEKFEKILIVFFFVNFLCLSALNIVFELNLFAMQYLIFQYLVFSILGLYAFNVIVGAYVSKARKVFPLAVLFMVAPVYVFQDLTDVVLDWKKVAQYLNLKMDNDESIYVFPSYYSSVASNAVKKPVLGSDLKSEKNSMPVFDERVTGQKSFWYVLASGDRVVQQTFLAAGAASPYFVAEHHRFKKIDVYRFAHLSKMKEFENRRIEFKKMSDRVDFPTDIQWATDDSGFITQKDGAVWYFENNFSFLKKVLSLKVISEAELGVLSVTANPNFKQNRKVYVSYNTVDKNKKWFNLSEFILDGKSRANFHLKKTKTLFRYELFNVYHTSGKLMFGKDGFLYISTGDSTRPKFSQDLSNFRGKILRVDVNGDPYSIPKDNPFVSAKGAAPEVYAFGLRNPWRFSFGPSGKLFIGDVGENSFEEVNRFEAGDNGGWPILEGLECYTTREKCKKTGFKGPLVVYSRVIGSCVIGGTVYQGREFPDFEGNYIFADCVSGKIMMVPNREGLNERDIKIIHKLDMPISTIAWDPSGELYVSGFAKAGIFKLIPIQK